MLIVLPVRRPEPGPALVREPTALAADRDDVTLMQQRVEDRGRDNRIAKDCTPFAHRAVGG